MPDLTREQLQTLAQTIAQQKGIDPELVMKVISAESGWDPGATSSAGAQGLMQLMPGTAKDLGVTDSMDPQQNMRAGVEYLAQMLQRFGGDPTTALAAYNFGPGNVARGNPWPQETLDYVSKIQGPETGTPVDEAGNPLTAAPTAAPQPKVRPSLDQIVADPDFKNFAQSGQMSIINKLLGPQGVTDYQARLQSKLPSMGPTTPMSPEPSTPSEALTRVLSTIPGLDRLTSMITGGESRGPMTELGPMTAPPSTVPLVQEKPLNETDAGAIVRGLMNVAGTAMAPAAMGLPLTSLIPGLGVGAAAGVVGEAGGRKLGGEAGIPELGSALGELAGNLVPVPHASRAAEGAMPHAMPVLEASAPRPYPPQAPEQLAPPGVIERLMGLIRGNPSPEPGAIPVPEAPALPAPVPAVAPPAPPPALAAAPAAPPVAPPAPVAPRVEAPYAGPVPAATVPAAAPTPKPKFDVMGFLREKGLIPNVRKVEPEPLPTRARQTPQQDIDARAADLAMVDKDIDGVRVSALKNPPPQVASEEPLPEGSDPLTWKLGKTDELPTDTLTDEDLGARMKSIQEDYGATGGDHEGDQEYRRLSDEAETRRIEGESRTQRVAAEAASRAEEALGTAPQAASGESSGTAPVQGAVTEPVPVPGKPRGKWTPKQDMKWKASTGFNGEDTGGASTVIEDGNAMEGQAVLSVYQNPEGKWMAEYAVDESTHPPTKELKATDLASAQAEAPTVFDPPSPPRAKLKAIPGSKSKYKIPETASSNQPGPVDSSNVARIGGKNYRAGEVITDGPHAGKTVLEIEEDGIPILSKKKRAGGPATGTPKAPAQ